MTTRGGQIRAKLLILLTVVVLANKVVAIAVPVLSSSSMQAVQAQAQLLTVLQMQAIGQCQYLVVSAQLITVVEVVVCRYTACKLQVLVILLRLLSPT